ncbi:hypothetical protein [Alteromonas gilva]|uniref:TonB-dependent receptor n=1 Tax=Alteromonas gilva TaxID=2987522 RepID=A0ABT5L179_9ALTE|nr:hypothetical protein [Alteromonas gilva]MDC8830785.1 hypothetical protein [Alteromonas gilva]
MKLKLLFGAALSCLITMQVNATYAPVSGAQNNTVTVVERSGKPPFKRRFTEVKSVDVAQFETVSTENCENVKTVVMRGKPPYKRTTECVGVVDVAQFEITNDSPQTDFSGRPPFKRH